MPALHGGVHRARKIERQSALQVASAVDYAVCATASLFVGNAYSAFSYLLREGALVRGAAERAGYYNLDASDGGGELGDITRREAVRWGVLPLGTRQLGAG